MATYWYGAVRQYNYNREPDVLHANVNAGESTTCAAAAPISLSSPPLLAGHFTQLVWADTRHFGVGRATSRSGKILVVAHYAPAGNVSGAYKYSVLPPAPEPPPTAPPRLLPVLSSESTATATTTTTAATGSSDATTTGSTPSDDDAVS